MIGLLTFKVKLILAAVLIVVILFGIRWWGNRQYYAGREEEKKAFAEEMAKATNKARDDARAELAIERETIAAAGAELEKARQEFVVSRQRVDVQMRARLSSIETTLREDSTRVLQEDADKLPDVIRTLNAELRAGRSTPNR